MCDSSSPHHGQEREKGTGILSGHNPITGTSLVLPKKPKNHISTHRARLQPKNVRLNILQYTTSITLYVGEVVLDVVYMDALEIYY